MSPTLRLDDVSLSRDGTTVLSNASVEFSAASTTFVVGDSGSGKSALLKVAAGLLLPERGSVRVDDTDIYTAAESKRLALRAKIGFLFQDSALWANRNVLDNVGLPLLVHRRDLSAADIADISRSRLARFGLDPLAAARPHELSDGEQKAVALVRALVLDPELVLMDEPLQSVDHRLRSRIEEEIGAMRDRKCTIVAVTHDEDLTAVMAEHLVVMRAGEVLTYGPFDEVKASPDAEVRGILEHVLGEIVSYDTDLLQILSGDGPTGLGDGPTGLGSERS